MTITVDIYCKQLDKVKEPFEVESVCFAENARLQSANQSKKNKIVRIEGASISSILTIFINCRFSILSNT